jgi:hypothetical protein
LPGWNLANSLHNQRIMAIVALVNNTGVLFEILGMVVFAIILALFHHHQRTKPAHVEAPEGEAVLTS